MPTVGTTVIKGTFYWPCLGQVNKMKGRYTLDVGQLSDNSIEKLKALGVGAKVKKDEPRKGYKRQGDKFVHSDKDQRDKPDRGTFITVQSKFIPEVLDSSKAAIDPNAVGEGSLGQVRVQSFNWSFGGNDGNKDEGTLGAGFNAVVVNKLEFRAMGGDDSTDDFSFDKEEDTAADTTAPDEDLDDEFSDAD